MSEENQTPPQAAVPVEAVVAYLSDLYRQMDAISFNIRTNINNIMPKVDGEVTNASSESEVR
jgi:hypothetical protein